MTDRHAQQVLAIYQAGIDEGQGPARRRGGGPPPNRPAPVRYPVDVALSSHTALELSARD